MRDRTAVPPPRDESAGCAEARELRTRGFPPRCAEARSASATHSPVYPQLRRVLDQIRFASSLRVALRSVDAQVLQRLRPTHPLSPTSAPGLGSPCHICNRTGLTPATSAPGRGSLPHLHRDLTRPRRSAGDAVVEGGRTAYPLCGIRYPTAPTRRCQQAAVGADCALHATGRFLSNDGDFTAANLRGNARHLPARHGALYCTAVQH